MTRDRAKAYEWDAENRLVAVKQGTGTVASFTYDGYGRRVGKTVGGVTRSYIYDGDEIVEERGPVTLRFVHGPGIDQHLAQYVPGGAPVYLVADHRGSVVRQTGATGNPTLTREYDTWGNLLTGASSGRYAYTGRESNLESEALCVCAAVAHQELGLGLAYIAKHRIAAACGKPCPQNCPAPGYAIQFFVRIKGRLRFVFITRVNLNCNAVS